ncbi:autotransporter outer membrane beta-barrel domain-containing protein [Sphingobium algorifonticola]|uniref:Autotransporter outer membrane beta-barrel domain-containing protein n=1 Tax=Sphingobium algorifonticola TaxID=2008318 RepID=A0A437J3J3_9SPHN|nr:autotransporter outer membrane beta-barrel domain-containing protein [Sphingobium algorifonticola]RVT39125.1 autotransporter outer membrane beta-barrel domain-containing protein [Sphingobium algorifonticola]
MPDDDNGTITRGAASASNRYGIHVDGAAAGSILNDGSIYVEGQNSGGLVLEGNWTGDITHSGAMSVIGDYAKGISTQNINGDLNVSGAVSVAGYGSEAISLDGDVTGTVTIQGTVTKRYSFTDDDGSTVTLSREALRLGTAAVSINGNVEGGIYIAAPPVDRDEDDDDEDNDDIEDSDETTGSIVTYGNGPALQVGSVGDIIIGSVVGNVGTHSIVIDGTVSSNATYSNTDAYGIIIGGQGGNVTLTDGIGVSGSLSATSYDQAATALLINQGSTVNSLYNSGTIAATLSSGGDGFTTGIRDLSGTLTSIENTGYITASGTSTDVRNAIDLSSNTTGVTIIQYLNDDDAEARADYVEENDEEDPNIYAKITGDIRLGSGNDTLSASTGEIDGNTYFGGGNDSLTLADDTVYTGDIYFGTGVGVATLSGTSTFSGTMDFAGRRGTVTIGDTAKYSGDFSNADNVAVTLTGGTLIPNEAKTVRFGSLDVRSGGTIGVYVDGDQSSTINVGSATLADGASVTAVVDNLATAENTYTVLTSANLDIQGQLANSADLPFIFKSIVTSDRENVYLTISRKTTDELGLKKAQAAAWDATYLTAQNNSNITNSFLQVEDSETLNEQVGSLLPDHAGGVFNSVSTADRLVARHIADDTSLFNISDVGGWLEPIYWRTNRKETDVAAYKANGWGLSTGIEKRTGLGYFGVSYAYLPSTVENNGGTGKLDISQHNVGAFWRIGRQSFLAWARIGASRISIDSTRTYTGTLDDTDFSYTADGSWNGWLVSGVLGASYRIDLSDRFSIKPKLELEQMWLKENGYDETANSAAIALSVASRTSKSLTATPSVTASYSLGEISRDWRALTFQVEAGRRQVLNGNQGDTTAYFNGDDEFDAGANFTIAGDDLKGAWIGEASVLGGGYDFTWKLTTRAEKANSVTDLSARVSLSVAF